MENSIHNSYISRYTNSMTMKKQILVFSYLLMLSLFFFGPVTVLGASVQNKYDLPNFLLLDPDYYVALGPKTLDIAATQTQLLVRNWQTPLLIFGGSLLFDTPIKNWVVDNTNDFTKFVGNTGYSFGHPIIFMSVSAATYVYGYSYQNAKLAQLGLEVFEGTTIAVVLSQVSKLLLGRERPSVSDSNGKFVGPNLSLFEDRYSFPSTHSATVWSTAAILTAHYPKDETLKWSVYGFATYVSLSRVLDNANWLSDVLVGSAMGYIIGQQVASLNTRTSPFRLIPFIQPNSMGIAFNYSIE